jgi:23S rRNA pseudouridine2604 synthase
MILSSRQQLIRLNKLMASKGLGSRRESDQFIASGFVKVNGEICTTLGIQVPENAIIELSPQANAFTNTSVVLHKPLGIISCQPDPEHPKQPAIQLLTTSNYFHNPPSGRQSASSSDSNFQVPRIRIEPYKLTKMAVAGRLDVNSTGLLLFTQCGVTARTIIGPNSTVEKEYLVRVSSSNTTSSSRSQTTQHQSRYIAKTTNSSLILNESDPRIQEMMERLRAGVQDGADYLTVKSVDVQNDDQFKFILTSGKHHHIRRMCEAVGCTVQAIKRVRIGNINLGQLPTGKWRYLKSKEKII